MTSLGFGDYLCECCTNFMADGVDGFNSICLKQMDQVPLTQLRRHSYHWVRFGKRCKYGFKPGVPSHHVKNSDQCKARAYELLAKLSEQNAAAENADRLASESTGCSINDFLKDHPDHVFTMCFTPEGGVELFLKEVGLEPVSHKYVMKQDWLDHSSFFLEEMLTELKLVNSRFYR